jgi:iron-sulfur cluster insertion protein
MMTITESAKLKILDLLLEEDDPDQYLRTFVQGGGCSGMSYGFTFDVQNEDDFIMELAHTKMVVDPISMQYLSGATLDYKDDLQGSQFVVSNPNAQSTCGCGSSFNPV